ncbi:hypothetical protein AXO1947_02210 [Xanthomonas oryzae pv. oryzae]|nr:hypothetical protein AXO1947_02210 [Xanthomonas oryzae pv. oryzae]
MVQFLVVRSTVQSRHLLERHDLARKLFNRVNAHLSREGQSLRGGTIVDATIIVAPSSTKNKDGERDPDMHQTKKGNRYYFGMKAHILATPRCAIAVWRRTPHRC